MVTNLFQDVGTPSTEPDNSEQEASETNCDLVENQYYINEDDQAIYRYVGGKNLLILAPETSADRVSLPSELSQLEREQELQRRLTNTNDKKKRYERIKTLLIMRNHILNILDLQEQYSDESCQNHGYTPWEKDQAKLNELYDKFVSVYGPINKTDYQDSGFINDDGIRTLVVKYPNLEKIRKDPYGWLLSSIEDYNEATGEAKKTTIFHQRVIQAQEPITSVNDLETAIEISNTQHGKIDFEYIAKLLDGSDALADTKRQEVLKELASKKGYIFYDPEHKNWVTAQSYLTGNVRKKLERVKRSRSSTSHDNFHFNRNISALEKALPDHITGENIPVELGAHWIPSEIIAQFAKEELGLKNIEISYYGRKHKWFLEAEVADVEKSKFDYGTEFQHSGLLLKDILGEQKASIRVSKDEMGQEIDKIAESRLIQMRKRKIQKRFSQWIWEDEKRRQLIEERFNSAFNSTVTRNFKGGKRDFPGTSLTSHDLRPHQDEAIIRNIETGNIGVFHAAGGGKTIIGITAVHELKRLGRVAKPAIVTANSTGLQFPHDHMQQYLRDKVLMVGDNVMGDDGSRLYGIEKFKRQAQIIQSEDWDVVYMSQSFFDKLKTKPQVELQIMLDEYAKLQKEVTKSKYSSAAISFIKEEIEDQKRDIANFLNITPDSIEIESFDAYDSSWQDYIHALIDPNAVYFEDLGISSLHIDESHAYKNLRVESQNQELELTGSTKAFDLLLKIAYLKQQHPDQSHHVSMMTATPITNALSELYSLQVYLNPESLEDAGIECFDSWVAMFGEIAQGIELRPDGDGYRIKERIAQYKNIEILSKMFREFADIILDEDLKLPKPDKNIETIEVKQTQKMKIISDWLAWRSEFVSEFGSSREAAYGSDGILSIIGDGRMASIDPSLVWDRLIQDVETGEYEGPLENIDGAHASKLNFLDLINSLESESSENKETSKLDEIAHHIFKTWNNNKDKSLSPDDKSYGVLQMAFCDIGVPKPGEDNTIYDALKEKLIALGMPADDIEFIHDHTTMDEKSALSRRANKGEFSLIISSSQKGATGLNIQRRLKAIHHLDTPWTPDWLIQRNARADRQGNWNKDISIFYYIMPGSFDEYLWQTLERKAKGIEQIMKNEASVSAPERQELTEFFSMLRATGAQDPHVIELFELKTKLHRLEEQNEAIEHEKHRALFRSKHIKREIEKIEESIKHTKALQAQISEKDDETPVYSICKGSLKRKFQSLDNAQEALAGTIRDLRTAIRRTSDENEIFEHPVGEIYGVPAKIKASYTRTEKYIDDDGEERIKNPEYIIDLYIGSAQKPIRLSGNDILAPATVKQPFDKAVHNEKRVLPADALIIGKQWANMIVDGDKTWEIRKTSPPAGKSRVAIAEKGSKQIIGEARLVDSIGPMDAETMLDNLDKMGQSREETLQDLEDGYVYAWVLEDAKKYDAPIEYNHSAQVTWIDLTKQFDENGNKIEACNTTLEEEFSSMASRQPKSKITPTKSTSTTKSQAKLIEKVFTPLTQDLSEQRRQLLELQEKMHIAEITLATPFEHDDELTSVRESYAKLEKKIEGQARRKQKRQAVNDNKGTPNERPSISGM